MRSRRSCGGSATGPTSPPDFQEAVEAGEVRSFMDAPSFELWLQCVFLPNARAAARSDHLPIHSQVGLMAMRQYDYHSHVPEAQGLLKLLQDFDELIEGESS
ncbi:YqcC family protein [Humisphaera borealis]|uniref:YqcC family protein n=1 Tax=Humisphaera borealis TaxID=2807512 RepID=UPI0036F30AEF